MSETERERIRYGLACGFCTALRLELSAEVFRDMAMNPGKLGNGANDHCDANMLMLEAWRVVTGQIIFNPDNDDDVTLWNVAWDMAVQHRYNMRPYLAGDRAAEKVKNTYAPDKAAELGIAMGVYNHYSYKSDLDISNEYNGADEFMRRCQHLGQVFEAWCCAHVNFSRMIEIWPYYAEDYIGPSVDKLLVERCVPASWSEEELLALAVLLHLPVRVRTTENVSFSMEWEAQNWSSDEIKLYQVRTVRHSTDGKSVEHYTHEHVLARPVPPIWLTPNPVLFALYGAQDKEDTTWEFLFERQSYAELYSLVKRLLKEDSADMPKDPVMQYSKAQTP
jgi:hypothetical protein